MKKLKKILLVDDDPVNNYLNEQLLEDLAIAQQICIETNGKMALAYLLDHCQPENKDCPSLVIFDHFMPVMDGMEFIQALHDIDFISQHKVVFILLGVATSESHIEAFTRMGVHEFTRKPLSKEVVMDAYQKYFSTDKGKSS